MFNSPIKRLAGKVVRVYSQKDENPCNSEDKTELDTKMTYTIVAPETIRSNSNYHISINVLGTEENKPFKVKIMIIGNQFSLYRIVEVNPYSSELLHFEIPSLKGDHYVLFVEGLEGYKFQHKKILNYDPRKYIILGQTDKTTYRPGELVRFRGIVLGKSLTPANTKETIHLTINNSEKKIIKQIENIDLKNGMFYGGLRLLPTSKTGTWTISIGIEDENELVIFEVQNYISPIFEVKIDMNKSFLKGDKKIAATITANYIFGKPVEGEAVVIVKTILLEWPYPFCNEKSQILKEISIPLNGEALITLDIEDDLKFGDHIITKYIITATVEDKLTKCMAKGSEEFSVSMEDYRINLVRAPTFYNENIPIEIIVTIEDLNGLPLRDYINSVEITLMEQNPGLLMKPRKYFSTSTMDEDGLFKFTFIIKPRSFFANDNCTFFINGKYLDLELYLGRIVKSEQRTKEFYINVVNSEKAPMDEPILLQISSNCELEYLLYEVVCKAGITDSGCIKVPKGNKNYTLNIKRNFSMIPIAHVFVYFIKNDELFCQVERIDFDEDLENNVEIHVPEQVNPGEELEIEICSKPNSSVGLLGVNQTIKNNEIDMENVFKKVKELIKRPCMYHNVRLITMTNVKFTEYPKFNKCYCRTTFVHEVEDRRIPKEYYLHTSCKMDGSFIRNIKENIFETLLWDNIENTENSGKIVLKRKMPETATSCILTGFSIHPEFGICFTPVPKIIKIVQPFFVTTSLPYSVRKGEVTKIPAIVFNYQNKNVEVKITLKKNDQGFEFIDPNVTADEHDESCITTTIEKNSGVCKYFSIRPIIIGCITFKLSATSSTDEHNLERELLVELEETNTNGD